MSPLKALTVPQRPRALPAAHARLQAAPARLTAAPAAMLPRPLAAMSLAVLLLVSACSSSPSDAQDFAAEISSPFYACDSIKVLELTDYSSIQCSAGGQTALVANVLRTGDAAAYLCNGGPVPSSDWLLGDNWWVLDMGFDVEELRERMGGSVQEGDSSCP